MKRALLTVAIALATAGIAFSDEASADDVRTLIPWLLEDERKLDGIPFPEVIKAATGKRVLPVDPERDAAMLEPLSGAVDGAMTELNAGSSPIRDVGRINEASHHVEEVLRRHIGKIEGWSCTIPQTSDGREQRSGYPDLRIVTSDGSVIYLDPKLFAPDNKTSSLRTFYYEPKTATNKVRDDAMHLLLGIRHNGAAGKALRLEQWKLVDLSRLRVQLKAEFQASNRDLYGKGMVVGSSP